MNNQIDKAVEALNNGGIIIFPTDTAFGIGCRIDRKDAIQKLFRIRKRPESQAVPILVSSLEMAKRYALEIPQDVISKLIVPYWPGALTVVLKANEDKVPTLVRGGTETVGLRMPNNKTVLEIIEKTRVPVLGPSANFHGENTPYESSELNKELLSLVDYAIDGECVVKKASTVVDCIKYPWKILRQGAIELTI